jgi:uncharacterized protein YjbI with pentapeptide repeats
MIILRGTARSRDVRGGAALSLADLSLADLSLADLSLAALSLAGLTLAALRPVTLAGHAILRRPLARPDDSGADPSCGASPDA